MPNVTVEGEGCLAVEYSMSYTMNNPDNPIQGLEIDNYDNIPDADYVFQRIVEHELLEAIVLEAGEVMPAPKRVASIDLVCDERDFCFSPEAFTVMFHGKLHTTNRDDDKLNFGEV